VTVTGLDTLDAKHLRKSGGVLFLPNHPTVFVDPTLISLAVNQKFPLRPIIVEYMYYAPIIHPIMKMMDAIPIPNNEISTNSLKKKRSERAITEVMKGLKKGENFLIYPAGRVKTGAHEVIGGASGVHQIISSCPEANIVLVRITGLWGSSFSKALTGKSPSIFPTIWKGVKHALKNFLFFTPRRTVNIEFFPVGNDFPREASKIELNRYLENWYNRPDGFSAPSSRFPGETLQLVSYSTWKKEYLPIQSQKEAEAQEIDLSEIPHEVHERIYNKLSKMTELPITSIGSQKDLSVDLGLDSLDISELVVFLEDQFDVHAVPVQELTTVEKLIAIAGKKISVKMEEDELADMQGWLEERKKEKLFLEKGDIIPEVFLRQCEKMKNHPLCTDLRSGVQKYSNLKLRALVLARYIKKIPGKYIGVLLPSSVAATVCILAVQFAGKVPVMINWTVGPRHLETVVKLSGVQKILTAWSFVDRLVNVDLTIIDDKLLMLEDIRRELGYFEKFMAFIDSKRGVKRLLKKYQLDQVSSEDHAVLLFTSGTESMPKGVPLSHRNILCNQRQIEEGFPFYSTDILLSILPPFHSFGFTVTTLLPILSGVRTAYFPDPTDGNGLAKSVDRWKATLVCGAPSFLKNMLRLANPDQLKTLRYVVSGAEALPTELIELVKQKGLGNRIVEGYGITECSPVISIMGKAVIDEELLIIHPETHEVLPIGKTGVILVRGPNVFSGYLNKEAKTPFITIEGKEWYFTGDLGFLDQENHLIISGRLKRFIKIGGEMISLPSLETVLQEQINGTRSNEGVSLAVCAKEASGDKPRIFVFTTFKTSLEDLNSALRKGGFSTLVKITDFRQLEEIPLMGTGKVNYRELESRYF